MAGILTAYMLSKKGAQVIVLEADRVGSGQTGRTTAKITAQHGVLYSKIVESFGRETAKLYAAANMQAVNRYKTIIEHENIDCDFKRSNAYLYSVISREPLIKEAETARALGIDAVFSDDAGLPFKTVGAVSFKNEASFHPLKFLFHIAGGLEIYEKSPVISVEGDRVNTPEGSVTAKHIVFATHYPFINVRNLLFTKLYQERSYLLALTNAKVREGMYFGIDPGGLSIRPAGEYLLLGGGSHRTGKNQAGNRYAKLELDARRIFKNSAVAAKWSAQDCMTVDGLPLIGRLPGLNAGRYVATGFGKWGMTGSMAAATILSGMMTGKSPSYSRIFSPGRLTLSASAKRYGENISQAAGGLTKNLTKPDIVSIQSIRPGHGGIVEISGRQVGIFKSREGKIYAVSPRCPHMGCRLEWNQDELSWDCPCHGSRFDYNGRLLDNPAKKGLTTVDL